MPTLVLVGNAPSSGSTFLSDLLDCTPVSASGPELNLFSNRRIYDYPRYREHPRRCGVSPSVHTARICIFRDALPAYGLDIRSYERLVIASADFPSFVQAFCERYLALRGKRPDGTVFEKTPQNVNVIGPFLEAYPQGWFIHLVRNPAHVYASLLKRGFPPWIALVTWLVDVAQYLPFRDHPRVISLRYEDLVRAPYREVARVLQRTCPEVAVVEDEFMRVFRDNPYTRLFSGRVGTWSVQRSGVVMDANRKPLAKEVLAGLAASLDFVIRPAYANAYGIPVVGMRTAIRAMGYEEALSELLHGVVPDHGVVRPDLDSWRKLAKKALYAMASGQTRRGMDLSWALPVAHGPEEGDTPT